MAPILVGMGEFRVADNSTQLMCVGLGSCVGVVLHDPRKRLGGLAHIMLPYIREGKSRENPGKFADSSIEMMIKEIDRLGSQRRDLQAKLYGGANMFPNIPGHGLTPIGDRNVEAVREVLGQHRIKIVEEDTGGRAGRTIVFDPEDGNVRIKFAHSEKRNGKKDFNCG